MKDFYITFVDDRVIFTKNPEPHLVTLEDLNDLSKRYLYQVGDKILSPFNHIETIKEIIIRDPSSPHGYEWIILVKENDNQYKPIELGGIVVGVELKSDFEPKGVFQQIDAVDRKKLVNLKVGEVASIHLEGMEEMKVSVKVNTFNACGPCDLRSYCNEYRHLPCSARLDRRPDNHNVYFIKAHS